MKLAYSYIRFSSGPQKHGHSQVRQAQLSSNWCQANGAELDTELNLKDLGVSAFHNKNFTQGALGGFVTAVDAGRVPKGSYLLIESFDRLSRAELDTALQSFREILKRDIKIVTLTDNRIYDKESLNSITDLIVSIVILSRAHEESAVKAFRGRQKWEHRRKNLGVTKINTRFPSWLTLEKPYTEFHTKPAAVKAIQRIFKSYANGIGVVTIARELNEDGIPCISERSKIWKTHYIQQLLRSRAVIGEFLPHKRSSPSNAKVPAGLPVSNYFPKIIDDALFNKVQYLLGKVPRDTKAKTEYGVNLFAKKLFCPYCGERMFLQYQQITKSSTDGTKKKYGKVRSLTCVSAKNGKCLNLSWPLIEFEKLFLSASAEIQAKLSLDNKRVPAIHQVIGIIETSIANKEATLARIKKLAFEDGGELPEDLLTGWRALEGELGTLRKELIGKQSELAAAKARNPYEKLGQITSLTPQQRVMAYDAIQSTISRIYVFFAGNRFQHAKAVSLTRSLRNKKIHPTAAAHLVRKEYRIPETRFFVAELLSPGKDKRVVYPQSALTNFSAAQDLPDDAIFAVK